MLKVSFWTKFGKFNLSEDKSIILKANIGSGGAWEGVKDRGSFEGTFSTNKDREALLNIMVSFTQVFIARRAQVN